MGDGWTSSECFRFNPCYVVILKVNNSFNENDIINIYFKFGSLIFLTKSASLKEMRIVKGLFTKSQQTWDKCEKAIDRKCVSCECIHYEPLNSNSNVKNVCTLWNFFCSPVNGELIGPHD